MNKITKSNYEEFMIDHLDGTLSTEREAELLLFLEANPAIKEELDGLSEMVLEVETPIFDCPDCLKKSILDSGKISAANFEDYCIAYYENDLITKEQEHLQNFVHDHPSLKKDYELYALLKLAPNSHIEFPYKTNLQQFASETSEPIGIANYLDFLIAQNEGDLSLARTAELTAFLNANTKYKAEAKQFASLKLHADTSIVFENKSVLKRRAVIIPLSNKWMNVAAASVAMVVVLYAIVPPQDKYINPIIQESSPINTEINHTIDSSIPINEDISNTTPKDIVSETKNSSIKQTAIKTVKTPGPEKKRPQIKIASVSTLACNELSVKTEMNIDQPSYPVDILAQSGAETAEADDDGFKQLNGYAGKAAVRISKLISKSDRLKKDRFKGQLQNFVNIAVSGFNKMTEGDMELPYGSDKSAEDKAEE